MTLRELLDPPALWTWSVHQPWRTLEALLYRRWRRG